MEDINQKIRRSTRDIKRPKFDDEIVESVPVVKGLLKKKFETLSPETTPEETKNVLRKKPLRPAVDKVATCDKDPPKAEVKQSVQDLPERPLVLTDRKRKEKLQNASKTSAFAAIQNKVCKVEGESSSTPAALPELFKRWTVQDDILLMTSVTHLCDLNVVHSSTPFSKSFSLAEIDARWYGILYDSEIHRATMERIEKCPEDQILAVQAKTPFSAEEEEILCSLGAFYIQTPLSVFENLLNQYRAVFHHSRTAHHLEEHWRYMKHYNLMSEQSIPIFDEELLRLERQFDLSKVSSGSVLLTNNADEKNLSQELYDTMVDAAEWESVIVKAVTGVSHALQFDKDTLAVLKGRCVSFDIRKSRVLLGRSTMKHRVDVNLTYEGPTSQISRRQAVLKIEESGQTNFYNIGEASVFVDKKPIPKGEHAELHNNSMIEIGLLRLLYLKNVDVFQQRKLSETKSARSDVKPPLLT